MKSIFAAIKLIIFICILISYFAITIPGLIFIRIWPSTTRSILAKFVTLFQRICNHLFNVRLKVVGLDNFSKKENYLIVANHISYLDIHLMSTIFSSMYVTSKEMEETILLGDICKLAGCVFVDRRSNGNRDKELQVLTDTFNDGLSITIFPEAKSTKGDTVIGFKRGLFQSAINTNTTILPVTLNYKKISGKRLTINNRDEVAWYDDMTFFPHFWNFLKQTSIEAELTISEPIRNTSSYDFTNLANKSHEVVLSKFVHFD